VTGEAGRLALRFVVIVAVGVALMWLVTHVIAPRYVDYY
jgi:hypothetical protein